MNQQPNIYKGPRAVAPHLPCRTPVGSLPVKTTVGSLRSRLLDVAFSVPQDWALGQKFSIKRPSTTSDTSFRANLSRVHAVVQRRSDHAQ